MRHIFLLMIAFMTAATPGWALDHWEDEEGFAFKDDQLLQNMAESIEGDIRANRIVERYQLEFDGKTDTVAGIAGDTKDGVTGIMSRSEQIEMVSRV